MKNDSTHILKLLHRRNEKGSRCYLKYKERCYSVRLTICETEKFGTFYGGSPSVVRVVETVIGKKMDSLLYRKTYLVSG